MVIELNEGAVGARDTWDETDADSSTLSALRPPSVGFRTELLHEFADKGWAHIRIGHGLDAARTTLAILAAVGTPIQIFRDFRFWRPIGVRLDKEPSRSEGTGAGPFHMDFVNARRPPRIVCLYCERPDPAGGGISYLSDLSSAVNTIDATDREALAQRIFSDGRVENLDNIGDDINPFGVVGGDDHWPNRYTGSLLHGAWGSTSEGALRRLEATLRRDAVELRLDAREALLFDNRRMVHARGTLGPDQAVILPNDRRLLYEGFAATLDDSGIQ